MAHVVEATTNVNGRFHDPRNADAASPPRPAGAQAERRRDMPAPGGRKREPETDCPASFAAAVVDLLPILPMIASVATVFAYVGGPTLNAQVLQDLPLTTGFVVTVILGGGAMLIACHLSTTAEQVHPQSYAELRHRADRLTARLLVLSEPGSKPRSTAEAMALAESQAHCMALVRGLSRGGTQWVLGCGYLALLARVHRAEEALFLVEPVEEVLAGALYDELRVQGSAITDCRRLVARLQAAVQLLSPTAALHLNTPPTVSPVNSAATAPADATASASGGGAARAAATSGGAAVRPTSAAAPALVPGSPGAVAEARATLREIRRLVNDFRDERREALVRSRCRLLGTTTVTGLITYVLLAFTVNLDGAAGVHAAGVSPAYVSIVAATTIYLVGAAVGLFNRLYFESGDDAAGEDYGLSRSRLVLTPILSGLAAVGGVLISAMLMTVVDGAAMSPVAARPPMKQVVSTSAAGPTPLAPTVGPVTLAPTVGLTPSAPVLGAPPIPSLPTPAARTDRESGVEPRSLKPADVFNLDEHPFSIVLAAIFGLTPGLFLDRLKRASEQPKAELQSTEAHRLEPAASKV